MKRKLLPFIYEMQAGSVYLNLWMGLTTDILRMRLTSKCIVRQNFLKSLMLDHTNTVRWQVERMLLHWKYFSIDQIMQNHLLASIGKEHKCVHGSDGRYCRI